MNLGCVEKKNFLSPNISGRNSFSYVGLYSANNSQHNSPRTEHRLPHSLDSFESCPAGNFLDNLHTSPPSSPWALLRSLNTNNTSDNANALEAHSDYHYVNVETTVAGDLFFTHSADSNIWPLDRHVVYFLFSQSRGGHQALGCIISKLFTTSLFSLFCNALQTSEKNCSFAALPAQLQQLVRKDVLERNSNSGFCALCWRNIYTEDQRREHSLHDFLFMKKFTEVFNASENASLNELGSVSPPELSNQASNRDETIAAEVLDNYKPPLIDNTYSPGSVRRLYAATSSSSHFQFLQPGDGIADYSPHPLLFEDPHIERTYNETSEAKVTTESDLELYTATSSNFQSTFNAQQLRCEHSLELLHAISIAWAFGVFHITPNGDVEPSPRIITHRLAMPSPDVLFMASRTWMAWLADKAKIWPTLKAYANGSDVDYYPYENRYLGAPQNNIVSSKTLLGKEYIQRPAQSPYHYTGSKKKGVKTNQDSKKTFLSQMYQNLATNKSQMDVFRSNTIPLVSASSKDNCANDSSASNYRQFYPTSAHPNLLCEKSTPGLANQASDANVDLLPRNEQVLDTKTNDLCYLIDLIDRALIKSGGGENVRPLNTKYQDGNFDLELVRNYNYAKKKLIRNIKRKKGRPAKKSKKRKSTSGDSAEECFNEAFSNFEASSDEDADSIFFSDGIDDCHIIESSIFPGSKQNMEINKFNMSARQDTGETAVDSIGGMERAPSIIAFEALEKTNSIDKNEECPEDNIGLPSFSDSLFSPLAASYWTDFNPARAISTQEIVENIKARVPIVLSDPVKEAAKSNWDALSPSTDHLTLNTIPSPLMESSTENSNYLPHSKTLFSLSQDGIESANEEFINIIDASRALQSSKPINDLNETQSTVIGIQCSLSEHTGRAGEAQQMNLFADKMNGKEIITYRFDTPASTAITDPSILFSESLDPSASPCFGESKDSPFLEPIFDEFSLSQNLFTVDNDALDAKLFADFNYHESLTPSYDQSPLINQVSLSEGSLSSPIGKRHISMELETDPGTKKPRLEVYEASPQVSQVTLPELTNEFALSVQEGASELEELESELGSPRCNYDEEFVNNNTQLLQVNIPKSSTGRKRGSYTKKSPIVNRWSPVVTDSGKMGDPLVEEQVNFQYIPTKNRTQMHYEVFKQKLTMNKHNQHSLHASQQDDSGYKNYPPQGPTYTPHVVIDQHPYYANTKAPMIDLPTPAVLPPNCYPYTYAQGGIDYMNKPRLSPLQKAMERAARPRNYNQQSQDKYPPRKKDILHNPQVQRSYSCPTNNMGPVPLYGYAEGISMRQTSAICPFTNPMQNCLIPPGTNASVNRYEIPKTSIRQEDIRSSSPMTLSPIRPTLPPPLYSSQEQIIPSRHFYVHSEGVPCEGHSMASNCNLTNQGSLQFAEFADL